MFYANARRPTINRHLRDLWEICLQATQVRFGWLPSAGDLPRHLSQEQVGNDLHLMGWQNGY
jgi:hypothetical protein